MEKKVSKRLPYGNTNFESIRTENYVYIDKTRYIELLENEDNDKLFFTRPRKFGKSLFFSTLSYYYDINQAGKFDQLFGDLYIGKHPTPRRNSYLVLNFNFSGLDTSNEERFMISFSQKVQDVIYRFLNRYKYLFPEGDIYNKQIDDQKPGVASLWKAFSAAEAVGKKIYVIIDEYDHVANDLIALGTYKGDDIYRNLIWANGVIRDFYETLKEGCDTVVDRIILTGITPVMLDDVTSGFNISNNISLDPIYNEMLGFTQDEVNTLMEETGVVASMINVDMELFYNGYLFHQYGEHRVYNPSMMLYLFSQVLRYPKLIGNIIDDNLKMDYGRVERLLQNNRDRLTEIAQNNSILSEIVPKFSIKHLLDSNNFVSLLFYLGMLTVDKEEKGLLRLKIPNYSIRTVFWEYIEQMLVDNNPDVLIDMTEQRIAMSELAYSGNPHPFIKCISKNIFSRLSNRDLRNFNEKYIKIILLHGLYQSNLYITITELEVSQGYTDIYMQRSHLLPDIPYEWVWEIKYIGKKDAAGNDVLKEKREEARVQLEKYHNSPMFAG
ncbi:MAG: ATP-binding protein, partial [Tannerella sp.]|nr:ATP-binding protein [Tannerella sp.]